jgi:hypothetical protein
MQCSPLADGHADKTSGSRCLPFIEISNQFLNARFAHDSGSS